MIIQRSFLLSVGFLLCLLGCAPDRAQVLMPDDISPPMEIHETVDVAKAAFEHNLSPILTTRCALAGCHVANGPHGLDFRTYESFIAGGEHGPVFIPGNAEESEIIEEIVSGHMPLGGPPLSAAEIQLFVEWINQQEAQDHVTEHEHGEEHDDVDMDDAHAEMDDAHDEDMEDDHGEVDDAHDAHDDMNGDHDDDDNGHTDDNGDNDHGDDN